MSNKTKVWIKAAAIRALKTFCQTLLSFIGTEAVALHMVNWSMGLSIAAVAGIISIITSVAGLPEVDLLNDEED